MGSSLSRVQRAALALFAALICFGATSASASDAATSTSLESGGLYLKVLPSHPLTLSKLKPGDLVEGTLSGDVYSSNRKIFSAGSNLRLVVDHTEKRRRQTNDHWPWVIKIFTPRHQNYPIFKNATLIQDAQEHDLEVSLISATHMREIRARAKRPKSDPSPDSHGAVEVAKSNGKSKAPMTMVLEANSASDFIAETDSTPPLTGTIPAGTACKILLLGDVSASKSKPGDAVHARLLEPVLVDSKIMLPAGTIVTGKVLKKTPPRWLSRAGSLYLTFNEFTIPEGRTIPVAASLAGAELDGSSHTRMDAEGRLHGQKPGAAWMAINFGVSAGISKEVDDGVQLIIEAIVSSATDASTAGTSRIIAGAASGLYMITRRGRDVVLPRFTELQISLDRPVSTGAPVESAALSPQEK